MVLFYKMATRCRRSTSSVSCSREMAGTDDDDDLVVKNKNISNKQPSQDIEDQRKFIVSQNKSLAACNQQRIKKRSSQKNKALGVLTPSMLSIRNMAPPKRYLIKTSLLLHCVSASLLAFIVSSFALFPAFFATCASAVLWTGVVNRA